MGEFKRVVNLGKQLRGLLQQTRVEFEFQMDAHAARTEMWLADFATEPDVGFE
ncbi:hypothetical protein LBMAG52_05080 [Planctomycetia bacterium]|nr:hypothetical protein LBMAG52_05080 [Planctomycetia bacterium]